MLELTMRGHVMASIRNHIQHLIDKLEGLPEDRLSEAEDFIDFLKNRERERQTTRAAEKLSEDRFRDVWDNPEDAVYDRL